MLAFPYMHARDGPSRLADLRVERPNRMATHGAMAHAWVLQSKRPAGPGQRRNGGTGDLGPTVRVRGPVCAEGGVVPASCTQIGRLSRSGVVAYENDTANSHLI